MRVFLKHCVVAFGLGVASSSWSVPLEFSSGTLLQDAEVEEILRGFADPLLKAAGLSPQDTHLYLVASSQVNAFATLGDMIFLNTGLILFAKAPEDLAAVLAHEIGHLAGRHIVRTLDAWSRSLNQGLLVSALGALVGGLSGKGDAAVAGLLAGLHVWERSFLSYSRGQESAADQAGLRYLKQVGWPLSGFETVFKRFQEAEESSDGTPYPYTRTHPLSQDRIQAISNALSKDSSRGMPPDLIERFAWLKQKIAAYMLPVSTLLQGPPPLTLERRYARAIALYRSGRLEEALDVTQGLLGALKPGGRYDPRAYLHELRAQIFFEKRSLPKAIGEIRNALLAKPKAVPIQVLAAQLFIESQQPTLRQRGIEILDRLSPHNKEDPAIWRLLSVAYGQEKKMGLMALALAEMGLRQRDWHYTQQQVKRAQQHLPKGTPAYQRTFDILAQVKGR